MGKRSLASLPHQPEPLAACTRTRTLFGVLFLLILAKKKLGSQRFADGASRCDLSQEYLHVNRGSREPRTASRSYMKEVLKVDREQAGPQGSLLCGPLWFCPVDGTALGFSPGTLIKKQFSQNSRTKQLCLPPGKNSTARALWARPSLESGPSRPYLPPIWRWMKKKIPSLAMPIALTPRDPLSLELRPKIWATSY